MDRNIKITREEALGLIAGTHIRLADGRVIIRPTTTASNLDRDGFPLHAGNPVWMD